MGELDATFKYVLLGNSNSGKSSILQMYVENRFEPNLTNTIAVDYRHKIVQWQRFHAKLQIFDTSGQQRFRQIISSYTRYVNAVFIVCDVTDPQAYQNILHWYNLFKEHSTDQNCEIILVANKIDLDERRVFTRQEGLELAESLRISYYETSATNIVSINNMFDKVLAMLIDNYKNKKINIPQEKNYLKENQELQEKIQYYQDIILIQKVISLICIIFLIFSIIFTDIVSVMIQMIDSFQKDNFQLFLLIIISFAIFSVSFIVYAIKTTKNDKIKIL